MRIATIALVAVANLVTCQSSDVNNTIVEELFLDLTIDNVRNGTAGVNLVQPWAELYYTAITERRYGDAVYARYHIDGQAVDGVYMEDNITVIDEIRQDAFNYAMDYPDLFVAAVALYNTSSATDTRPEVIEVIKSVNVTQFRKRITYSTSCSSSYLAPRADCYSLLATMDTSTTYYFGRERAVDYYGRCYLRLSPLNGRVDTSEYAIHGVGKLIYSDCQRQVSVCDCVRVSGYSPKNSDHRKICLSSKSTGCS